VLSNGATDIGLSILSVTATMSVWSAISPSFFTYRSFASQTEQERQTARTTMLLAGGASIASNIGMYLVFKRLTPSIIGVLATAALFALSWGAVHSDPPPAPSVMQQKRDQQLQAPIAGMLGRVDGLVQPALLRVA
jgi:hypothetical protein